MVRSQFNVGYGGTLFQLEEVIGKRIAEQYGKEILVVINDSLGKDPEDLSRTGPWVTPKGTRPPPDPSASITRRASTSRLLSKKTPTSSKKSTPATRKQEVASEGLHIPPKVNECIDLDSDSDHEHNAPPTSPLDGANGVSKGGEDEIEETDDDDDDDFVLFKRVKRR